MGESRSDSRELLRRLGQGESIDDVCRRSGMSRAAFDAWWQAETARRVPSVNGRCSAPVGGEVEIARDRWGVARVHAANDEDLFFGFGYAMAQDRLFQLDYLRRKATGTLAEVLGPSGLDSDRVARTIDFPRIARDEWAHMPAATRRLVESFSAGIDAWMASARDCLPIEFDLLDYVPASWTPTDCCAIAVEFRHYLTVRFPVIVIPELARRALGEGALLRAFMQGEADEESILHPGEYPVGVVTPGHAAGDPDEGQGSNNWVIAGARTTTGKPIVASDPHIAFAAVSCWYEVHLSGGTFDVAGMTYVGMPAVMFGRNRRVAWGITNNICSQRDLYLERTDPAHPDAFLHDGRWESARVREETIAVRGAAAERLEVRLSRNGPVVSGLLPEPARNGDVVTLRWLGDEPCGWLSALLDLDRAQSVEAVRESLRPWRVPTFSLVFADVDGRIGYQAAGAIPLRARPMRGYRPGWDPAHQWQGVIALDEMPHLLDPPRGWIATANNRPAPDDFHRPLSGTWSCGYRARRIRQMLDGTRDISPDDAAAMQLDALSLRAQACVGPLVLALETAADPALDDIVRRLRVWDHVMATESDAAAIFEVFFARWSARVAAERLPPALAALLGPAAAGLASSLLASDPAGWFAGEARKRAIVQVMRDTIDELTRKLGPDPERWSWGALHRINLRHVLSARGDLGLLLDRGGVPVKGNGVTVCNTGFDPNWGAPMGANYRLVADLATDPPVLRAVDAQGVSGHPGSEHYGDQLAEWLAGRHHVIVLGPSAEAEDVAARLRLVPAAAGEHAAPTPAGG
ncbi:MAG: penicillin acylase family protein [Ectothiorhodospiraceae bacterium]|nr:penicillin acylase family protein [Ectothiorhodospiraceae bacterium]